MQLEATGTTHKTALGTTVVTGLMPAAVTGLRGRPTAMVAYTTSFCNIKPGIPLPTEVGRPLSVISMGL